ncbi:hypothetical protein [Lacinutrix sp. Hel_I_90]|uniref:hypothetical protein n=1 Tax=Lacinutrix sp. Hel_I_90 TaxID=1249999 RepID=UPI0005C9D886|nr:hypothetical protein [Lacinutrix sp. Hel_I_90]
MIDKIKFLLRNYPVNEEMRNSYRKFGKSRFNPEINVLVKYLTREENLCKKNKKHSLKLTLAYDTKHGNHKLYIEGSIRKWYYGKYNIRDFNYKDFCQCISLLSKRLEIEENILWNAEITKLETGVTIRFTKEFEGIALCVSRYKNFKKNTYEDKGVKFKGKNYHVIFYDKIREIYNDKDKLERSYDKITKNNFLFRYEIQGHKVSGMKMFKNKVDTLLKVKNNWKYLGDNLIMTLDKVEFIDVISPEAYINLRGGAITEMSEFLIYKGIKAIGIEKTRLLIETLNPKKRTKCRKKYNGIYEKHLIEDRQNYEDIFRQKLLEKLFFVCRK